MEGLSQDLLANKPFVCLGNCGIIIDKPEDVKYSSTECKHVLPINPYDLQASKVCNKEVGIMTYGNHEMRLHKYAGGSDHEDVKKFVKNRKVETDRRQKDLKRVSKPPVIPGPPQSPAAAKVPPGKYPNATKTKALTAREQSTGEKEIELSEMREEHHKQSAAMMELENNIEQLNGEIVSELKDQVAVKDQKLLHLEQLLARRDEEISALTKFDDDTAAKSKLSRQIRDLESRVQEINKDLETEKQAKLEAEDQNQYYAQKLESVKAELERSKEHNKVLKELLSKRDNDYVELAVQFWDLTTAHEQAIREYKIKMDDLADQLENVKKVKNQMDMLPLNSLQVESQKTGEDLGSSHEKAIQEEKAK